MAGANGKLVLIGFPDEFINDIQKEQLDLSVNKFGGESIFPKNLNLDESIIKCPLCQLWRPLVVQIYAPLDEAANSLTDRILYLYACINPTCWNKNESWLCIRVVSKRELVETKVNEPVGKQTNSWCAGADDWEDDGNFPLQSKINLDDNFNNHFDNNDDDDDDSNSFDESLRLAVNNIVLDDDKNANLAIGQGAERLNAIATATSAEIEGDNEGECISIDSPLEPCTNLNNLMQHKTPLPKELQHNFKPQFVPFFLTVYEETICGDTRSINTDEEHIRDLLYEYQKKEDFNSCQNSAGEGINTIVDEEYEESEPAHGDILFHKFVSRIQANPGQILRYERGGKPLLLRPLLHPDFNIPQTCRYCKSEMVFEFQVLSTVIPSLQLVGQTKLNDPHLEFGTVLIYTCRNSCCDSSNTSIRIESVVLQTEVF